MNIGNELTRVKINRVHTEKKESRAREITWMYPSMCLSANSRIIA